MDMLSRLKSYEPLWENWYIDEPIGQGRSSVVYKIKNSVLSSNESEYCALKVISISIENVIGGTYTARMKKINEKKDRAVEEIKMMMRLYKSPYIVDCKNYAIKDVYDDDGIKIGYDILIQMNQYQCFSKMLSRMQTPLSEQEIIKFALQIGNGLKDAHDNNIIHRDVKPENIFVDNDGNYLLGDLGVSKQQTLYEANQLTTTGTPPYMAPEIYRKERYNKTVDIYSFGIVLYQLLNNSCLPFTNENSNANEIQYAIDRRLNGEPFPPPANGSPKLKKIVMKACSYDSHDRYQDINDMINDFKDISLGKNKSLYNTYKTIYAEDEQSQEYSYDPNGQVHSANHSTTIKPYEKEPSYVTQKQQRTNPLLIVMLTIAICLIIVLILAMLWMFVINKDSKKDESSAEPVAVVSSVAEEESSIAEITTTTTKKTTTKKTTTKKTTTKKATTKKTTTKKTTTKKATTKKATTTTTTKSAVQTKYTTYYYKPQTTQRQYQNDDWVGIPNW